MSTGLAYRNALQAPTTEVDFLAAILKDAGGIYVSHIRSEDDEIIEAIDEAIDIGRHAGVPVIISHLKCAGRGNWGAQRGDHRPDRQCPAAASGGL